MKQPLFIKNLPIDEKRISWIETVVSRLARRARTRISAAITPYPISACVTGDDVKGEVLRYMFCLDGIVSKAMVDIGKKPKLPVGVTIEIKRETGGLSTYHVLDKSKISVNLEEQVKAGDKLTVKVDTVNDTLLTEFWIAFAWVPKVGDAKIKSFLIDELENVDIEEE